MRIVEVFGAPGVGKSTLLARFRAQRSRNSNWVTESEALSRLRPVPGQARHMAKWLVNRLSGRPQGHLITAARDAFVAQHSAFASLCWSMIHEHRGHDAYPVDTRLGAATYLWACFGRVGSLREAPDPRLVLMDEGLVQRLVTLWSPAMDAQKMNAYLTMMPQPSAAILVVVDVAVAIERIRTRHRWSGNHLGMNDEQLLEFTRNDLAFSETVGEALIGKGVPICRVDAAADSGANLASMSKFLDALP